MDIDSIQKSAKRGVRKLKRIITLKSYLTLKNFLLLPQVLTKLEKISLSFLTVIIITAIFLSQYLSHRGEFVPDYGGIYTEGVLQANSDELQENVNRLTKIGLLRLDSQGNLAPDLAESWDIKEDGKVYTFNLRSSQKAQDILDIIRQQKTGWTGFDIAAPSEKQLEIRLKQPLGSFLTQEPLQPIFPGGPFKVEKQSAGEITLVRNDDYWMGKSYLAKITFKVYPDEGTLERAVRTRKVLGISSIDREFPGLEKYGYELPREWLVFFNLRHVPWSDQELRKKIARGEKIDPPIQAVLATTNSETNQNLAYDLQSRWSELGVNLQIQTYDSITFNKEIIPQRNYDLLLYGINYGVDPDPYVYWHSSQIESPGLNLAGFADKEADKLISEARTTLDKAKREERYAKFNTIFQEKVPAISLEKKVYTYSISKEIKGIEKIKGYSPSDRFLTVNQWYIKVKRK